VATVIAPGRTEAAAQFRRPEGRFARALRRNAQAYGFLAGAVLAFAVFTWYPMVREITESFQHLHYGVTSFSGLRNYRQITADPFFWQAWRNTFQFTALALVLGFALPFAAAVVINEFRHAQAYLRILVYLPVMLPPVAGILLFRNYFMDPGSAGLFNQLLHAAHLPTSQWWGAAPSAMPSLVLISTWTNMGGATLIYLAALQGIPGELYEAAEIDGAGVFKRIWHVTIPQTRTILSLLLMLQIVATMQMFTESFVATGGGPESSTVTIVYLAYNYAFQFSNFNTAEALGVIMFIVLGIFSAVYVWIERRGNEA
jgi:multiple sugar transport system permease protein